MSNVSADLLAESAPEEIEDPRNWRDLIRQWSAMNSEFSFSLGKIKLAVAGSVTDRVASHVHDMRSQLLCDEYGQLGFKVIG